MTKDYISYFRSKVGHDKVILTFAGGILENEDGQILLQLRGDKHTWAIPGGAQELGESTLDTCIREFYEETGIQVEVLRFLNIYSNFEEIYPNGDQVQTLVCLYHVKAKHPINIESFSNTETLKLKFFSPSEIAELVTLSDKHQLMLKEYLTDDFKLGW
ncbi:DNA mismatch repair protein MutT [Streptococcus iniae]|uniref:NUDIX hydrolase n=1 Tax=Streptococcus iniae TaxID=1346 RepID=UPI000EF66189|nr:NUDIX domain-containing protein [Streptococcus iniae]RLU59911.1 DNA mismatch repair protein MutT [Streptococcus iniae]RLU61769.1 DNA mismatch repair protein MutT [Streptococcus iniae]RLU70294.1 DNA mismatch repair protein MutT [Streptococcus iniae]RLU84246.1 DNA mismatch repair protein MutT [Streptococcus iniae]RLU84439.1 DNA mismatch repair protein MutT [Streptococcus iniae]